MRSLCQTCAQLRGATRVRSSSRLCDVSAEEVFFFFGGNATSIHTPANCLGFIYSIRV